MRAKQEKKHSQLNRTPTLESSKCVCNTKVKGGKKGKRKKPNRGARKYCLSVQGARNSRFVLRKDNKERGREREERRSFDSEGYTKNMPHISHHIRTGLRDKKLRRGTRSERENRRS